MTKKLKGLCFDINGKLVIKDGIALRRLKKDEKLYSYGQYYYIFKRYPSL